MSTTPWTETVTALDTIDDDTATELAHCELVQRALWAAEVGVVDLEALPPVPPSIAPANDDQGVRELLARASA